MLPPEFWNENGRRAPMLQALAWPVSLAYAQISAGKVRRASPVDVGKPVICVGNVTVGGVGKTPAARALAAHLRARGANVHVLLRGYGGAQRGPLLVDPARQDARAVGDEALLHGADGAAWVSRDRLAGARAAVAAGADIVLMDDGFQNMSLAKAFSFLVFDAGAGLGNRRVFPAGPLREPVGAALARADAAIVIGAGETPWLDAFAGPKLRARIEPAKAPPAGKLVAFAGIGRPQKFFDMLTGAGAEVAETVPFPDHHAFSAGDLRFLSRLAKERSARLVTTEKDYVRLPAAARGESAAIDVVLRFEDVAALDEALTRKVCFPQ